MRQSHVSFWLAQRRRGKGESHRRTAITCDPVCVYDLLCWRRPLISNIHIVQNLFTFLQAAQLSTFFGINKPSFYSIHPSVFPPARPTSGWGIMRSSASLPYTPWGAMCKNVCHLGGDKEVVAALRSIAAASGQSM